MDDSTKLLLQTLIQRIPAQMLAATLDKSGRLSKAQLHLMDFTETKWALSETLLSYCEKNKLTTKDITELEMIHDAHYVHLAQFKEQFKSYLRQLKRHVSVKIKKNTDESIWIRTAWGDILSRANHLKPTYVVHYLHNPHVFVTGLTSKTKPLLFQALAMSTTYGSMTDANLSGQNLMGIIDLLMRGYHQVFPTKYPTSLVERTETVSNLHIKREQAERAAKRHHMACEAFGDGVLPHLQTAVCKLETKFKNDSNEATTERGEPFGCLVKFSSTNLLESLRNCVSSGIASTPVSPLLSSVLSKKKKELFCCERPNLSSQTH